MNQEEDKITPASRRRSSTLSEIWYVVRRWSLAENAATSSDGSATTSARALMRRTSSAVWEERPQTPAGWTVLMTVVASVIVGYELQLQQQLTCPPLVFMQQESKEDEENGSIIINQNYNYNPQLLLHAVFKRLTQHQDSILSRPIQPSLWVGTRSLVATTLAVAVGTPHSDNHLRFREVAMMPADGSEIALDWEYALDGQEDASSVRETLLMGPIRKPVVLILHGLNNDSTSGYIRSLQRTITNRGHIAVGMSFRGCCIPLATPRPYTGAYTGDLRSVVHRIQGRLAVDQEVPVFLVGHSLGANLVTKYLGEEGLSGTLPPCVAGGSSMSNPFEIHSRDNVPTPWKQIMAWGVKLAVLQQWKMWKKTLVYPEFRKSMWGILMASSVDQVDEAIAPISIRNDPYYPFAARIGYDSVEEFWNDSSSYRFIKHVSVPLLQIMAGDDPVVYNAFQQKLTHSIRNPNVMSVETKCGGHLGWQESPPPNNKGNGSDRPSWAGRATADFIDAILEVRKNRSIAGQQLSSSFVPTNNNDRSWNPRISAGPETRKREHIPIIQSRL